MPQYQDYSQKYNKIKRVFSLRLEARDLLGILDYMALRDLECRNVSQMVTSFIQSHLEEYRSEDIIPSYAGEANLDETLSEKMVLAGRLAQARQGKLKWNDIVSAQSSSASTSQREALNLALANQDFAPPNNWVPDIVNDGSPTEVMGNPTDFSAPSDDPNNLDAQ
ncbi:MAG: hypothetical protein UT69_C0037G0005 [Candidatus Yanofskybacteria bacterium GW2011_GWE1_40_10]|nr:MAG: hypothetical protein UT69_C0037G0005 [Candidatus Yanofskybacteria bacterium GW2011_GWE1_40_10]